MLHVEKRVAADDAPVLKRQYLTFCAHDARSRAIAADGAEVYLRRSERVIGERRVTTIEIARVEVAAAYRSRGRFGALLRFIETHCPCDAVYVENVMEPRLALHLGARGYVPTVVNDANPFPSLYRLVDRAV